MLRIGSTLRTTRKLLNRNLHFQSPIIAGHVAPVHHRRQELHRFVRRCNYSSTVGNTSASASCFSTLSNNNSSITSTAPHAERAQENDSLRSDVSEVEPVAVEEQRLSSVMVDAYLAIELALDSVVKIFTVSSSPNYFLPWQNKSQRETTGSGIFIFFHLFSKYVTLYQCNASFLFLLGIWLL